MTDTTTNEIKVVNNHIYFYEDVTPKSQQDLLTKLQAMDRDLQTMFYQYHIPPKIYLHINSYGGDVFSALAIADRMKMNKTPIVTIGEGIVASAATIISMAGEIRYMCPKSIFLIHPSSGATWGTTKAMTDHLKMYKRADELVNAFYLANSTIKKKRLKKLVKRESWLDANQCLKYGFIDAIAVIT